MQSINQSNADKLKNTEITEGGRELIFMNSLTETGEAAPRSCDKCRLYDQLAYTAIFIRVKQSF